MREVHTSLLVVHGAKDTIVPLACGQKMHDAAGSTSKMLVIDAGANHNNLDLELSEGPARKAFEDLLEQVSTVR